MSIHQTTHSNQDTERVYTLVLNTEGKALVCHTDISQVGSEWSMLVASLPDDHDPIQAAKQSLYDLGYESQQWVYLGSYVSIEKQAVHFLFARNAYRVYTSPFYGKNFRWVCLHELRYALLDGRITKVGDATTVALAMYLMEPHKRRDTAVSPTHPFSANFSIRSDT